jgi:hypothetical protein
MWEYTQKMDAHAVRLAHHAKEVSRLERERKAAELAAMAKNVHKLHVSSKEVSDENAQRVEAFGREWEVCYFYIIQKNVIYWF